MAVTTANPKIKAVIKPENATRIILIVEYEGTRYHGFQLQADLPTIQGELEKAVFQLTGENIRVVAASRTDAGVHALGQVVSFRTGSKHSAETFVRALNYYLPDDIAVKSAHRATNSQNIMRDAISRQYNYYILNRRTRSPLRKGFYHFVPGPLDIDAMERACRGLIGEHDFASFVSPAEAALKSTVKRVYSAGVKKEGELVVFTILADSFLMHQVRNTVGPLIRVGQGKMSVADFYKVLEARQPGLAWPTAPPCGLCLTQVNYKNPFEEEI